jgi:hypothetical protein
MKTAVISAFPACGKTYAFNNYQNDYTMIDSDSSQYSWVKDSEGNNTKERNPDFPRNYIQHIKDNIGKVEIIFVSSHEVVRNALSEAGIRFCTVYPDRSLLNEWVGRCYRRGNEKSFIDVLIANWDKWIDSIEMGEHGFGKQRLTSNQYLDFSEIYLLQNW